jgi:hypothetical protein
MTAKRQLILLRWTKWSTTDRNAGAQLIISNLAIAAEKGRDRFLPEDRVFWSDAEAVKYAAGQKVNMGSDFRTLKSYLCWGLQQDVDLYGTTNTSDRDEILWILEGLPGEWHEFINTRLDRPDDFQELAVAPCFESSSQSYAAVPL